MKVEILMIGKISDKPYQQLVELYAARCRRRMPIELIHCKDDGEQLKRALSGGYIAALDEKAKGLNTIGFCKWLENKINSGCGRLTFCLGAADGLAKNIREKANEFISLSALTLNHQLALLVLAEQLYRAVSIMGNEPYHKA